MEKTILVFLFFIPVLISGQETASISYEEGLANCQRIIEENQKLNPDKYVYTGPECLIGARVPEFTATTIAGKEISSDYFKGKITILNFWIMSCQPCIAEIPGFNQIMNKYGPGKLNYLAISLDDEKDIKRFLTNNPWGFAQIASATTVTLDIFNARWGYPTTFVINEHAVIIAAFSGGRSDEGAVTDLEDKLSGIISAELK